MHETNRPSTCHIFLRPVSRRTSTSACPFLWFNRGPSCAECKRVLDGKSFRELSWDSGLARGTLDISWYCGIVVTTVIEVVSYGGYWLLLRVVVLQLLRSWDVSQRLSC